MNISKITSHTDTIAAIATPPGRGGIGIIRISGPQAKIIGESITQKKLTAGKILYSNFYNQASEILDQGLVLFFQAPHSFTGEDVVELQGHGGPIILDCILGSIIEKGACLAQAGEFSKRAFLNDKIDLTQAEAIADLIDASSVQAAKSASKSLQGEFSKQIKELVEQLIHLRIYVEAAIDFPEEEIDFLADGKIQSQLEQVIHRLQEVKNCAKQGNILREGMTVVIAGKPNAGKSSLLNALSESEVAIVTDIAGTTRDILKEYIQIDGMPLHIIDTAGLRESDDIVEQEGIRRAWLAIEEADEVLLMIDNQEHASLQFTEWQEKFKSKQSLTIVKNKIDLTQDSAKIIEENGIETIYLSAKHKIGIDLLKQHLKKKMGYKENTEGVFIARKRHLIALQQAAEALDKGLHQLLVFRAGEFLAEELRLAQLALSEITGEFTSDDLLGRIFSSFCIGK